MIQWVHAPRRDRRVSLDFSETSRTLYRSGDIPLEPEGRILPRPDDSYDPQQRRSAAAILILDWESGLITRRKPTAAARLVMRTDLLSSNMTAIKEMQVRAVLAAYRRGAVMLASEQWRLFYKTGRFNKHYDRDKTTFAAVIGAANRVQMSQYQSVGQLDQSLCAVYQFHVPVEGVCPH